MKNYTIVLNFGYVESASLSYMPWTSKKRFKDAKEALVDLANYLKTQYLKEHAPKLKKCCYATKEKEPTSEYCSKCGRSLIEGEFNGENFSDWLRQLETDIDTFNGLIPWDLNHPWQSNGLEDAPNPRYVYNAEWVLAAAVGHPYRDDITFEDICKERTKSKKTSFSYY